MFTIPGGSEKGKPLHEASSQTLEYWAKHAQREDMRAACAEELARRGDGAYQQRREAPHEPRPATPQPSHRQAAQNAAALVPTGILSDSKAIASALEKVKEIGHLVSPVTVSAAPPQGVGIAFNIVPIDIGAETYELPGGKRGLSKVALVKIGRAAGICWVPDRCRRLDDARDPHYVRYRAEGFVVDVDGTLKPVFGEVEIDMRDGSPQVEEIKRKAARRDRSDPDIQITEVRKFIVRHAESKAKLRAIRDLGIATSYSEAELAKPFVVIRAVFTGESDDPEIRRRNADRIAERFLGATELLFGAPAPRALPSRQQRVIDVPAEPVDGSDDDGSDGSNGWDF